MALLTLEPIDQGSRCRFTEDQWRVAVALADVGSLPGWAAPLDLPDLRDDHAAPQPVELSDALAEAVALRAGAVLEVEVSAVAGTRGVLALVRTDGVIASALVRGVEVRVQAGVTSTRLRPGVEVSAFPVARLLGEVMRLVPEAPVTVPAAEAVVPVELTVALGRALREGNGRVAQAILADLGLAEPPAVLDALVRTADGSLMLTTRSGGRADVSVGSWLRCAAGWVELAPAPEGTVRHTPRTRDEIARTLLFDVTGRFDAALRASGTRPDDGNGDEATRGDAP